MGHPDGSSAKTNIRKVIKITIINQRLEKAATQPHTNGGANLKCIGDRNQKSSEGGSLQR